jgi:hypothetical protein
MPFAIGTLVMTRGIGAKMNESADFAKFVVDAFYDKYRQGDWGDICKEDKLSNDVAVKNNDDKIFARYNNQHGDIYIITE